VRRAGIAVFVVVLSAILFIGPLYLSVAGQALLNRILIACLFTAGFSLLAGQMGLLSFGHAAFFGLGAFACLHVMIWVERDGGVWPTPFLPVFGFLAGGIAAAVAGFLAARRAGAYFSLITLAIAELLHVIATQWNSVFGGEAGLTSMRAPWLGVSFGTTLEVYYCTLAWTLFAIILTWLFTRSAFGRVVLAIRENEERARFLGYDVLTSKIIVFALSGALSGMAGGLLAMSNESVSYTLFEPSVSLEVALYTYIGGTGLFGGPIVAAALLTWLPFSLSSITRLLPLYQGLLFMMLMLRSPNGLAGLFTDAIATQKTVSGKSRVGTILSALGCILIFGAFVAASELTYRTSDGLIESGIARVAADKLGLPGGPGGADALRFWAWALAAIFCTPSLLLIQWGKRLRRSGSDNPSFRLRKAVGDGGIA
jgi:branched-chain amino acid transport system permease protein